MFRREWRQQILVLALLVVAIAAAVAGSAVATNASSDADGRFGSGGARITVEGDGHLDGFTLDKAATAAAARFGIVEPVAHLAVPVPGSVRDLDVRDQDPAGVYSSGTLHVVSGRYPTGVGEVALTKSAASLLDTGIGSAVALGSPATVVGIVENPAQLDDTFGLVAPGTIADPTSITLFADRDSINPESPPATEVGSGLSFRIELIGAQNGAVAAVVLTATTLLMALVGLIASAGFLVVAQRHQRQLGLVTAIGATTRQVRLVVLANGVIVALAAAVIGGALGIAGWIVAAPAVERAANHHIGRLDMPWGLVLAILVLAVVMSTLAAWWPARVAARQPVMAALAGRPAKPQPTHRSLLVAIAFATSGVVSIVFAHATSRHVRPLLLVVGLLAVVVGAIFVAPAAVRLLGLVARRLPFAPRLALRDLSRYQARAAAALAAITLGLGIAVGVIAVAAASQDPPGAGNLSASELMIMVDSIQSPTDPAAIAAQTASLDARAEGVATALGSGFAPIPLNVAFAASEGATGDRPPATLGIRRGENTIEDAALPFVATPEVLSAYGIDPATIDPAVDVLTTRTEPMLLLAPPPLNGTGKFERPDFDAPPASTQIVDLPKWHDAPNSLITETALQRKGWVSARTAWIIESPTALTSAQINHARSAAADAGLVIETRDHQDSLSSVRNGATLIGALLAMAIVAMTVGLIRGESARDVRTMTATGAAGRTRRAITASTAGALATLGVVLAVATAYGALIAAFHTDLGRLAPLPVNNLLTLLIGLPLAATAAGWVLAGREPKSFARQPID
ncbi:MAG: FtsX-like permease family protein [Ilumatobacteraceae bacterium]